MLSKHRLEIRKNMKLKDLEGILESDIPIRIWTFNERRGQYECWRMLGRHIPSLNELREMKIESISVTIHGISIFARQCHFGKA